MGAVGELPLDLMLPWVAGLGVWMVRVGSRGTSKRVMGVVEVPAWRGRSQAEGGAEGVVVVAPGVRCSTWQAQRAGVDAGWMRTVTPGVSQLAGAEAVVTE